MRIPQRGPWFRDGLRFECTRCGGCCTGAPGYVWVTEEEVAAIAALWGETVEAFARRHVRRIADRLSLCERPGGDCEMYDRERGCTVYAARPAQCRAYPFWTANVKSPEAWARAGRECPGIGRGEVVPMEEIRRLRNACGGRGVEV